MADDDDEDVRTALRTYNDPSKSMLERVGLAGYGPPPRQDPQEAIQALLALRTSQGQPINALAFSGQDVPQPSQDQPKDLTQAIYDTIARQRAEAAQRQLPPQSTAVSGDPYHGYGPPPVYEVPPAPQFRDVPKPDLPDPRSSFEVFKNPLVLLATFGSLFTRKRGLAAMAAVTGAMKGFQEGDEQIFNQKKKQFDEEIAAAAEQNRTELAKYRTAFERYGEKRWAEAVPDLWTHAAQNDDQIGMAAIRQGPEAFWSLQKQRDSINNSVEKATEIAKARADIAAEAKYGQNTPQAREASTIVDGMERGDQPPTTQGLYGLAGFVRSEAARRNFNLAQAQLSWLGAQTQMRSLHGPQMTRYFALAQSVQSTIDRVLETSENLKLGQYPVKNHADLIYLVQTKANTPEGKLAIQYLADIGTLKEEFANLAQGGGVPTEPAWAQANKLINEDFGVTALDTSLKEVRRLIGYRVGAIMQQGAAGYSPAGTPLTTPAEGGGGGGGLIRYDSEGNRVE